MSESSTIRHRPSGLGRLTSDRDWLAEFPAEAPTASRLLAGAATLPVIARGLPRSPAITSRARTGRPHRSILLMVFAIALLMISAGATMVGLWVRGARPLAVSEWPVSPPPLFSQPSAVPNPPLSAPAPESQPAPERTLQPEAAPVVAPVPPPAAVASARALTAPPAATGASDESAILSVLDRYRLAIRSLSQGSVRAVAFDNCRIDVQGAQAEAVCAGRVSLVTRAGPQARNIQSRRWTFTLARQTDTWKIRTVDSQ